MKKKLEWPAWFFWMSVFFLGALVAWNNSLTVTADLFRHDVSFKNWHPYVWEYSSFISTFILYFGIYWLSQKAPLLSQQWLRNLLIHVMASVLFSLLHVLWMVWLRQVIYHWMGGQYDFGDWFSEWLYEYRKDVVSYFMFLLVLGIYQHFTQSKKTTSFDSSIGVVNKFQVKNKQGVFWLNQADIITIESGGNYVYFHVDGQVLPMRATMAEVERQLNSSDFLRVHRSYIVNLSHIMALQKLNNDSSEIKLMSGKKVPVSKKYRANLLSALEQKTTQKC